MDRSSPRNTGNEFSRCRFKRAEIKSVFRIDRMGEERDGRKEEQARPR